MRLRFVISILVAVAIILTIAFWLRPARLNITTGTPQKAVPVTGAPATDASNQSASTVVPPPTTLPVVLHTNPLVTNMARIQEVIEKFVASRNKPIDFYGQVIDQDSNALSGVVVKSVVQQITMPDSLQGPEFVGSKSIEVMRTTDAAGRFEISGLEGEGFGVGLTKDGYEAEPNHRSFGPSGGSFEQPVIFKMWNTNIHEQLITGEKKFPIVPDGRPYVIDLAKGTISETGAGDLKVWVKRPSQITYGQRYDWSCEVDAINGGILQETDSGSSMYSAPANGYIPSFQFEQKVGSGWGDTTGPQRFYVRLDNGQEYGRITIELYARYNGQTPGLIRLSYAVNPSGSRILR